MPQKYRKFAATQGRGMHLLAGWQFHKEANADEDRRNY